MASFWPDFGIFRLDFTKIITASTRGSRKYKSWPFFVPFFCLFFPFFRPGARRFKHYNSWLLFGFFSGFFRPFFCTEYRAGIDFIILNLQPNTQEFWQIFGDMNYELHWDNRRTLGNWIYFTRFWPGRPLTPWNRLCSELFKLLDSLNYLWIFLGFKSAA